MKLNHLLTPYTRINSKRIKDLNVRLKTITILEDKIPNKISDFCRSNIFVISPHTRETKEKINKWDSIKLKHFCRAKETIKKVNRQPTK